MSTAKGREEREVPVTAVLVELICEDCGGSVEQVAGVVLTSYPAQYPHECRRCGKGSYVSGRNYPFVRHKREER